MIVWERPMTFWSPHSRNASVSSTCTHAPKVLESTMFSYIWIENHMHVKSLGVAAGLANARPPELRQIC